MTKDEAIRYAVDQRENMGVPDAVETDVFLAIFARQPTSDEIFAGLWGEILGAPEVVDAIHRYELETIPWDRRPRDEDDYFSVHIGDELWHSAVAPTIYTPEEVAADFIRRFCDGVAPSNALFVDHITHRAFDLSDIL